jgi:hypothetical protein
VDDDEEEAYRPQPAFEDEDKVIEDDLDLDERVHDLPEPEPREEP